MKKRLIMSMKLGRDREKRPRCVDSDRLFWFPGKPLPHTCSLADACWLNIFCYHRCEMCVEMTNFNLFGREYRSLASCTVQQPSSLLRGN